MKTACAIVEHILGISTKGIIPDKIYEVLKLLNFRLALYILMQQAEILDTCFIVRNSLTEQ
jgi:hypothetical protein